MMMMPYRTAPSACSALGDIDEEEPKKKKGHKRISS